MVRLLRDNPLQRIDPTGEFFWLIIIAVIVIIDIETLVGEPNPNYKNQTPIEQIDKWIPGPGKFGGGGIQDGIPTPKSLPARIIVGPSQGRKHNTVTVKEIINRLSFNASKRVP